VLTIRTKSSFWTTAFVTVDKVGARSTILARVTRTLIDLRITVLSRVAFPASTNEGITAVNASTMIAVDPNAIIYIQLAILARVTFKAQALIAINFILTSAPMLTWS